MVSGANVTSWSEALSPSSVEEPLLYPLKSSHIILIIMFSTLHRFETAKLPAKERITEYIRELNVFETIVYFFVTEMTHASKNISSYSRNFLAFRNLMSEWIYMN